MERTQIYLTQEQRKSIETLAGQRGQTMSEIIREALDRYIAVFEHRDRLELMHQAAGIWADRDDLPEFFEELRQEWERNIVDEPTQPLSIG